VEKKRPWAADVEIHPNSEIVELFLFFLEPRPRK
jgi:hypothetical protein